MAALRVIGLTFDLREEQVAYEGAPPDFFAEFDSRANIDHLERAIASLGYEVVRLGNIRRLAQFLSGGGRVDLVFNMAVGGSWSGATRPAAGTTRMDMLIDYIKVDKTL